MRANRLLRAVFATALAMAVASTACGTGDTDAGGREGPAITVASFDFPESQILAQIYAQALEAEGYPVERRLNLGPRELIFPALERGELGLLPEYIGSALSVGFGVDPPTDADEAHDMLTDAFAEKGVRVLDYAPGEDANVYVVTREFADEHNLESISDLDDVEQTVAFGAPPECEQRETCLLGLRQTYELDNLEFRSIGEFGARVAALEAGEIQLVALFSTQPVITQQGWVALEDDRSIIPPENIVPVVREELVEAHDGLVDLLNSVTERITTEVLLELNGRVELEADDPDTVATDWLRDEGFLD